MRYNIMETHDFKCRLCGTKWLNYVENNTPCPSLSQEDGRHNFDFSKPIKVDPLEKQSGTPEVQESK
ncbi:MAG: hypothetical protein WBP96_08190 [Nitrososphaeraceae archaeon]